MKPCFGVILILFAVLLLAPAPPLKALPGDLPPDGGMIAGRVTEPDGSTPLPGIQVDVCALWGFAACEPKGTALTDAEGRYAIVVQPIANFLMLKVTFRDPTGDYLPEVYDGYTHIDFYNRATPVRVDLGQTTIDIDAALTRGGRISGRVTAADGNTPLVGIRVVATLADPPPVYGPAPRYAVSDTDGNYTVYGLWSGHYSLAILDPEKICATEHRNGDAQENEITAGIDMAFTTCGAVRVRTQDQDGQMLAGVSALLWQWNGDTWETAALSPDRGRLAIGGLAPGDYRLQATFGGQSWFYPDADNADDAEALVIAPGTVLDVDFVLPLHPQFLPVQLIPAGG